jgi:hypothetical protein
VTLYGWAWQDSFTKRHTNLSKSKWTELISILGAEVCHVIERGYIGHWMFATPQNQDFQVHNLAAELAHDPANSLSIQMLQ